MSQSMQGTYFKYIPVIINEIMQNDRVLNLGPERIEVITAMKEYDSKSLEELRIEDYLLGLKGNLIEASDQSISWFIKTSQSDGMLKVAETSTSVLHSGNFPVPLVGTTVPYCPVTVVSEMLKNCNIQDVDVKIEAITAMKKYECKSFEELRLEDYLNGHDKSMAFRPPSDLSPPISVFNDGKDSRSMSHPQKVVNGDDGSFKRIIASISQNPFGNCSLLENSPPKEKNLTELNLLSTSPNKPLYVLPGYGNISKAKPIGLNRTKPEANNTVIRSVKYQIDEGSSDNEDDGISKTIAFPKLKVFQKSGKINNDDKSSAGAFDSQSEQPILESVET